MVKSLLIGTLVGVLSVHLLIEIAAAGDRFGRHLAARQAPRQAASAASAASSAAAAKAATAGPAGLADWQLSLDLVL